MKKEKIWQKSKNYRKWKSDQESESRNYLTKKVKVEMIWPKSKNYPTEKVKIWPRKWKWKLSDNDSESENDLTKKVKIWQRKLIQKLNQCKSKQIQTVKKMWTWTWWIILKYSNILKNVPNGGRVFAKSANVPNCQICVMDTSNNSTWLANQLKMPGVSGAL